MSAEEAENKPQQVAAGEHAGTTPEAIDVTIIVPVTSDKADIESVEQALGAELDRLGLTWECILVFDGITGPVYDTGLAMQADTRSRVKTINLHRAFGESACLMSAFGHARGKLILTSPQYVQVDPACLEEMVAVIEQGSDFAASWRSPRIDHWLNRWQSSAFNLVMRIIVGTQFHDLNSQLRLFRRNVLEDMPMYGDMYRYLPAIAFRKGFQVSELKVRHLAEWGSAGIYSPGVYVRRIIDIVGVTFLTRFLHKPLRFFGVFGGALMSIGGLLAGGVALQWSLGMRDGIYHTPLFLLGLLLFILGVQIIGFGLVGEIIVFTQARNVREYRVDRIYE